ncbi:MFS transporter [[Pseudopropionibacterium] massiliense]|uniref:MFS transporter n=1 Tax=[Pseudopropionibacterium] massiliense TaxID=2220000 RepID=UPI00102FAEBD|nr:MFS transporter [[Pseudopropionibacterium] massiliense]
MNTGYRRGGTAGLLVGLLLAVFAVAFQMIGVAAALPEAMRSLDAAALYPWAFSMPVMGMLASILVAGRHCDRHGPLVSMGLGFGVMFLGLIAGSFATDVWLLLAARLVQGLGAGALNLSLFVVIALAFPAGRRPAVLAMLSFCWVLPAFLGPPVSAALVAVNWRLNFAATMPLLLVAAALTWPHLKALQERSEPDPDAPGIAPWAVAAVAGAPALLQLAGQGFGQWSLLAGFAGVSALGLGLPKVLPPRVRSLSAGLGPIVASRALQAGAFFAGEAFLLLGLQNLKGLDTFQAGLALTIGSLGWSLGSWLQSRMRLRRDRIITFGTCLVASGTAGIAMFLTWVEVPLWVGVTAWTLAGCGMGLTMSSTAVATMALSGPQEQGRNSSALQVAESLGNSVMTALTGACYAMLLAEGVPAFGWIFLMLLAASVLAIAASLLIGPVHDVAG